MGMFDYECSCPVCHGKVDGFQTKSGDCLLKTLNPREADNFYSSCKKCGCWIEFTAKKVTNFTRQVKGKGDVEIHKYNKDVRIS